MSGPQIAQQPALVEAAKKAGRVRRFIPSEFGLDSVGAPPGSVALLDWKRALHDAFGRSSVPTTYVYANCFASFWASGLGQLGLTEPPRREVNVFGTGEGKAAIVTVEDVARYTAHVVDDPNTEDREVTILPRDNLVSQHDLITTWETISGTTLQQNPIPLEQMEAAIASCSGQPDRLMELIVWQLATLVWAQEYTSKRRADVLEATELYPDVGYERLPQFLGRFAER